MTNKEWLLTVSPAVGWEGIHNRDLPILKWLEAEHESDEKEESK